jgi:hypothetical protein
MAEALRVNFSDQEAGSEAFDFEPIPSGKYHVKITEITEKASTSEKNPGKPYWNVEMVIQDGKYVDRKIWANVMLFDGALYSLSQLLKATGNAKALETGKIPPAESFITQSVIVIVVKQKDTYKMEQEGSDEVIFKNEVKGFKAYEEGALATASSKGGSLLP